MKNQKGFTLVELIVVAIILGIIGFFIAIACFLFSGAKHVADHGAKSTVERIWEGKK